MVSSRAYLYDPRPPAMRHLQEPRPPVVGSRAYFPFIPLKMDLLIWKKRKVLTKRIKKNLTRKPLLYRRVPLSSKGTNTVLQAMQCFETGAAYARRVEGEVVHTEDECETQTRHPCWHGITGSLDLKRTRLKETPQVRAQFYA